LAPLIHFNTSLTKNLCFLIIQTCFARAMFMGENEKHGWPVSVLGMGGACAAGGNSGPPGRPA
jgi:hypothetical protein